MTLLDVATQLDETVHAVWRPTVGEHSIQCARRGPREDRDPDRIVDKARSRKESQRRSAVTLRRFVCHNRIDRLLTLTFAAETLISDRGSVVKKVQAFFRILRIKIPGIKYVYTLELHPGGHGYHIHAGLDRWVSVETVRECWTHGFIDLRRITTKSRGSARDQQRQCARYLAKYACKAEDEGRESGGHRYERSQGDNPTEHRIECDSWAGAEAWLRQKIRRPIRWEWSSQDVDADEWKGPRTLCLWE